MNTSKMPIWLLLVLISQGFFSCGVKEDADKEKLGANRKAKPTYRNFPNKGDNSLLWEISGNGLPQNSFLYGTIHMICEDKFFMPNKTIESFEKTKQLVLEVDMDDTQQVLQLAMGQLMADSKHLRELLPKADYALVSKYFEDSLDQNLELMGTMKPMFLQVMMIKEFYKCGIKSYEEEFMQWAHYDSMEVLGLELIADQMAIFDKIPLEEQAKMLVDGIKNKAKSEKQFNEMVDQYLAQDVVKAYEISMSAQSELAQFEDVLLIERNKNWIPKMKKMAAEKPTFFAVGAAHLSGPNGVIELLKKEGYTLTPVR